MRIRFTHWSVMGLFFFGMCLGISVSLIDCGAEWWELILPTITGAAWLAAIWTDARLNSAPPEVNGSP